MLIAPVQAEAPAPAKLPPVEGLRPQGALPAPAEVALPLSTKGCASCNASANIAQYPAGCSSGTCNGTVCLTEVTGPPVKAWTDTVGYYYMLKAAPQPNLLTGPNNALLSRRDADLGGALGYGVSGGSWFNSAHTVGYGYNFFMLEQRSTYQTIASDGGGNPLLSRPFIDAVSGDANAIFVADPGRLSGTLAIANGTRLAGGDVFGLKNVYYHRDGCRSHTFNLLAGFRYMDLDEFLEVYQHTAGIGANPPMFTVAGTPTAGPIDLVDRFRTRNQFYGFEIGSRCETTWKCVSLALASKLAMGDNHQTLDIAGQTKATGAPTTQGGFLALSSNIGNTRPNRFALLADVSFEFGVQITKGSRLYAAYDFIYLNEAIRPGSEVDNVINTRFVPASANYGSQSGPTSPIRDMGRTDFFAQGIRFGYSVQY